MAENLKLPMPSNSESVKDPRAFIETLRQATYCAILGAFVQGLGVRVVSPAL